MGLSSEGVFSTAVTVVLEADCQTEIESTILKDSVLTFLSILDLYRIEQPQQNLHFSSPPYLTCRKLY